MIYWLEDEEGKMLPLGRYKGKAVFADKDLDHMTVIAAMYSATGKKTKLKQAEKLPAGFEVIK